MTAKEKLEELEKRVKELEDWKTVSMCWLKTLHLEALKSIDMHRSASAFYVMVFEDLGYTEEEFYREVTTNRKKYDDNWERFCARVDSQNVNVHFDEFLDKLFKELVDKNDKD